jgi:hypothetical protein
MVTQYEMMVIVAILTGHWAEEGFTQWRGFETASRHVSIGVLMRQLVKKGFDGLNEKQKVTVGYAYQLYFRHEKHQALSCPIEWASYVQAAA